MLSLFSLKSVGKRKKPKFFHPNWLKELTEVGLYDKYGHMARRSASLLHLGH